MDIQTLAIIAVAVIVGIFTLIRGRADVWKSNYEAERNRADRVQKELDSARVRLSTLEALPSLEKLYETIVGHDAKEQVVWERITGALGQITSQLDIVSERLNGK